MQGLVGPSVVVACWLLKVLRPSVSILWMSKTVGSLCVWQYCSFQIGSVPGINVACCGDIQRSRNKQACLKCTRDLGSSSCYDRWKLQSPWWRWQYIVGPAGYHRACGLRVCGLVRFPFWVACRGGRTAADVSLSDCQYCKGAALYGWCRVYNIEIEDQQGLLL